MVCFNRLKLRKSGTGGGGLRLRDMNGDKNDEATFCIEANNNQQN